MLSRTTFLLLCCLALFPAAQSSNSILKGFDTKEVPSLEDIPGDIASIVYQVHNQRGRELEAAPESEEDDEEDDDDDEEEEDDDEEESEEEKESKSEKKEKSEKESKSKKEKSKKKKRKEAEDLPQVELPEATQNVTEKGELRFAILLDEFGYSTADIRIGTRFAFSGRLASENYHVGNGSGVCTIASDINTNFGLCNFYLKFNQDGDSGFGTLTLAGNTDDVGGVLQVTGSGGDLKGRNQGLARLAFDPSGGPVIYILIGLE